MRSVVLLLVSLAWSMGIAASELTDAAQKGDVAKIQALLKANPASVNEKDEQYGGTALHFAASYNRKAAAEMLLAAGANVNAKAFQDQTPLRWALRNCALDVAKLLIAKGADVNESVKTFGPPLFTAIGWKEGVELLLANGANVEGAGDEGETAMFAAPPEIARLLLAKKANINATNKKKWTPAHRSACAGDVEKLKWLSGNGADMSARNADGQTPLDLAIKTLAGEEEQLAKVDERFRKFNEKRVQDLRAAVQWLKQNGAPSANPGK